MQKYADNIEAKMQRYYHSLSEKDRRRYAAIEAVKLGYGGQVYIRRLFGKLITLAEKSLMILNQP